MSESLQTPPPPQSAYTASPSTFDSAEYQRRQDNDQLQLLAIFHYVMGAMLGFTALFPLGYVGFGAFMYAAVPASAQGRGDELPNHVMGEMFITIGLLATVCIGVAAAFTILAGRDLAKRKGLMLIQVISFINCLHMPIGTALGVFTLIVVNRPSVRAMFDRPESSYANNSIPEIDRPSYHDR